MRAGRQRHNASLFYVLVQAFSTRQGPINGVSYSLKIWIKDVCFPASRLRLKVCVSPWRVFTWTLFEVYLLCLKPFVKDQVTIGMWVQFWVINSISLSYLPVIVPIPCFSVWAEANPTKNETSSLEAKKLLEDIIVRYGLPSLLGLTMAQPSSLRYQKLCNRFWGRED